MPWKAKQLALRTFDRFESALAVTAFHALTANSSAFTPGAKRQSPKSPPNSAALYARILARTTAHVAGNIDDLFACATVAFAIAIAFPAIAIPGVPVRAPPGSVTQSAQVSRHCREVYALDF